MDTPIEGVSIARETPAKKKRNQKRAKVLIDKRYAIGQRIAHLVDVFRARLGPDIADDPIMEAAIARAAETTAIAERMRAQMLRGEPVSADDVLRTTRAADLMTRRLHLDRHTTKQTTTLSSYLSTRGEQT